MSGTSQDDWRFLRILVRGWQAASADADRCAGAVLAVAGAA
jgi:hypothetical protein